MTETFHSPGSLEPIEQPTQETILDDYQFFRTGIIEIHFAAPRGNDSQLTRVQAAELTRDRNRAEALIKNFIDKEPLLRRSFETGMTQIMTPSTPYAYGGVMIAAAGEALFSAQPDEEVRTEMAFDMDPELGREYYRQILASIQAQEDVQFPRQDNSAPVVAYENSIASISNEQHRLPRTIALPHAHIIKGGEWIQGEFNQSRPAGFSIERAIVSNPELFATFQQFWQENTEETEEKAKFDIALRAAPPYGYTITTDIERTSDITLQATRLFDLLKENHTVYDRFTIEQSKEADARRRAAREQFNGRDGVVGKIGYSSVAQTLKIQPSYRTYLYYKDNKVNITIAPMLLAHAGGLETMDVAVDRSSNHPNPFTEKEMEDFTSEFLDRVKGLLG